MRNVSRVYIGDVRCRTCKVVATQVVSEGEDKLLSYRCSDNEGLERDDCEFLMGKGVQDVVLKTTS